MRHPRILIVCALVAVALPTVVCRPHAGGDQRYELKGKVVSVDKEAATVTIAHEAIPGYKEAMVTRFKLNDDRPLQDLAQGDRVHATLVVAGTRSWLDNVVSSRESTDSSNPSKPDSEPSKVDAPGELDKKNLYHGVGAVESIDVEHATVQIDHEDIKDVMPAMSMPYIVKDKALLEAIVPGDKVDFWLESTDAGLIIVEIKKR
jgi:Cu/Ag efflux protein CusF